MSVRENLTQPTTEPKIVVVGAGAAGLACATRLLRNGFDKVYIVEAESRIGGRIKTVPFADCTIDLGAQWCHGEKNNVVFDMIKDLNLLETSGDVFVTAQCIRSNGEVLTTGVADRLKLVLYTIYVNRAEEFYDFEGTFADYLKIKYDLYMQLPMYADISEEIKWEFFENYKNMTSSESSIKLEEISARGFNEYWECEGDYLLNFKDKGYTEFLRVLIGAKELNNQLGILEERIIFSTAVNQIDWQSANSMQTLHCENMKEPIVADHVVLTVSLGVLKAAHEKMFKPNLPADKVTAIEGCAFGNVLKVFLEYPFAFWPSDWTGFATLWRAEDLEQLKTTAWPWLADIFGFYSVNYQPRILVGWVVGRCVPIIEALSEEERNQCFDYVLKKFLPDWAIPEPLNVMASSWSSNKSYRGAYSYRSLKTEELKTGAAQLAEPIDVITNTKKTLNGSIQKDQTVSEGVAKPVLLFAGEATHEHYFSTVHGAVETGWREAERLIKYYSE